MKFPRRLILPLVSALALPALARAQTTPAPTAPTRPPAETTPTTAEAGRFATFTTATATVQTAVGQAVTAATTVGPAGVPATPRPAVATAITTANTAIVQEGQAVRADVLAQRQAALTRLRLAQTEQDRRRVIEELRLQAGQRMDEQRETARLVRDRLRELRDLTTVTRPPGS